MYCSLAVSSLFFSLPPSFFSLFELVHCARLNYPVQTVKCNIILYNLIERKTNLLVDLCALIMAVPVNELRCKYVFDCAVQLDVNLYQQLKTAGRGLSL